MALIQTGYTYIGDSVPYTNDTGAELALHAGVMIGNLLGILANKIANGESCTAAIKQVFSVNKTVDEEWGKGDTLHFNEATRALTIDPEHPLAGCAHTDAAAADLYAQVNLNVYGEHITKAKHVALNSTGSLVSAGDPFIVNGTVVIAAADIADSASGPVYVTGVHRVPKNTIVAMDQFDVIFFDAGTGEFSKTPGTDGGLAYETVSAGAAFVLIFLQLKRTSAT